MMNWNELLNEERPSGERFAENPELNISPFERDYYTIVESSYFRRLQRKTQVYTLDDNDYVRTRLTHSMEVAAIAELLGKRIAKRITELDDNIDLPESFSDKLSMVLRCAGLLHDFGNPPFGHKGEVYIRKFFKDNEDRLRHNLSDQMWNDLINFDGNTHTLRIITKLGKSSNPNSDRFGMDLTNAVINSIIKYPWNSLESDRKPRDQDGNLRDGKIGCYHSEEWILTRSIGVMNKTGTLVKQNGKKVMLKNPIMLILEAADDIAYATADIEDAIKTGRIGINDFLSTIHSTNDFTNGDQVLRREIMTVREKSMTHVIDQFMTNYNEIMNGSYEGELIDDDRNGSQIYLKDLKRLVSQIYSERDNKNEYIHQASQKMNDILERLIDILQREETDRTLEENMILDELQQYIDKGNQEVFSAKNILNLNEEELSQEELYHKYLAIVDFLSGMTDSYVTIFSDRLHSDYYKRKGENYKKDCLIELSDVGMFSDCDRVVEKMSKVDTWNNNEMRMILSNYLKNEQISGAVLNNNHAKVFLRGIARKYSIQDSCFGDKAKERINNELLSEN